MNTQQQTLGRDVRSHGAIADRIVETGFALAVVAGLTAVFSGLGNRWGWWYFMTAIGLLKAAAISGGIAAIISLSGGVLARQEHRGSIFLAAAAGIMIGLLTAGIPLSLAHRAESLPLIHDITTDMANPPQFKAIMPLRYNAENSTAYGGRKTAAQQVSAYPDIRPLMVPLPQEATFNAALLTAKNSGWQIINSNAREGRIEAVATTFWFGFKDDVVVRVTAPASTVSRVDIRSVSRVGLSDIGANADRIRRFMKKMNASVTESSGNESIGY